MKVLLAALVLLNAVLLWPEQASAAVAFVRDGYLVAYVTSAVAGFGCL